MKAIIVGGGIGGLAAAVAFHRRAWAIPYAPADWPIHPRVSAVRAAAG
ncbi:hypothetical protein [Nonomuraea angiospora]|nr:hypothetical protein [Nonomuraea angiospora]MDX3101340.1 hypothetical protein [Nonomuraea angiospora]